MKKIRKRLLTLFLGTSCTIMASCSGDKSKTNKSNGALGNKDSETTPTGTPTGDQPSGTTIGDLPGETPNNPPKGGHPNTPGTSGKSGGGTTGGNPNSGGKEQQPQPFVLSQDVTDAIAKMKKDFPGFGIPADADNLKGRIADHILPGKGGNVTSVIELGGGTIFASFQSSGVSLTDGTGDGYMNAGNTSGIGGGYLAGAFNKKFGEDEITKALNSKGIKCGNANATPYGSCISINKKDWDKDVDLFYAVGVTGKPQEQIKSLGQDLFYVTIDYLRNKYSKGNNAHLSDDQIKKTLGNSLEAFEAQVKCNYETIQGASAFAKDRKKTKDDPYYLLMNPISAGSWGFDQNAAAYINLAIMYYLTSITEESKNLYINMWCYKNDEDTPYIKAINELNKK